MHEESPSLHCTSVPPNPLVHSHISSLCSLHSPSLEYYIDATLDNPMIFKANVDLGYEKNVFDILDGNVDDYVSILL